MKKLLIIAGVLLIAGIPIFYFRGSIQDLALEWKKSQLPAEIKYTPSSNPNPSPATQSAPSAAPVPTPPVPATTPATNPTKFTGVNLAVPFSSQAPYQDWSLPYGEACEETSSLLIDRFYKNKELTPAIAKEEILKMVGWENRTFGYNEHTTAEETAQMLKEYFGYKRVDVIFDPTLDDFKAEITAGRPIILPLAGREIKNPYYRQPGPVYHMLVVKGLTENGNFITNDVGTRRGANYVYDAQILYNAIHDAPAGANELNDSQLENKLLKGRKAMIVVYPN